MSKTKIAKDAVERCENIVGNTDGKYAKITQNRTQA